MSSEEKKTAVIVTAGKSKSGKSTALNNLFGTDFKTACSASSGTTSVNVRCMNRPGLELIVVDTVGLAATDINPHQVQKDLQAVIGGLKFLLLYCFSISPLNPHSVDDETIVKNLTKILGKDIWNKCVLLFTGCDIARTFRYKKEDQREEYKKYFDDHVKRFSQLLSKTCGYNLPVKPVFEVDISAKKIEGIVAIPMGMELEQTHEENNLTPGIKINWKALADSVVLKKAEPKARGVYTSFMDSSILKTIMHSSAVGGGLLLGLGLGGSRGAALGLGAGAAMAAAIEGACVITKSDEESKLNHLRQKGQKKLENPDLPKEPDLVQSVNKVKIEGNLEVSDRRVNREEPDLSPY